MTRRVPENAALVGRTATADIYDRGDGTSTAIVHAEPINFRDRMTGAWRSIDSRLVTKGSRLGVTAGPVPFELSQATGEGDLVRVSDPAGWSLGFSFEGAAKGKPAVVSGSSAQYRDVLPGVHLEEAVLGSKLRETIILERPLSGKDEPRFRFPLSLGGLTPRLGDDGSIQFFDAQGVEVARMPRGWAVDTAGGDTSPPAYAPVKLDLVKVKSGWAVDVSVDQPGWLADPTRVYPVSIDPDLVFLAGRESTGWDSFVSWVSGEEHANFNTFADPLPVNFVGKTSLGQEYYTYMKFDLAPLRGHTVVNATWGGHFNSVDHQPNMFSIWKTAGPWSDTTITRNNQPGHTSDTPALAEVNTNQESCGAGTGYLWVCRNITGWVQAWVDDPSANHGVMLDTQGQSHFFRLSSMETASQNPRLDANLAVTFTNAEPTVPTQAQLSPPHEARILAETTRLAVSPAMTDANPYDQVRYWFRLATGDDAETGQQVNSGWTTNPYFDVPAGVLRHGATYYWKVFVWDGFGSSTPARSSWPPNKLKVNLGLHEGGAFPTDQAGPVSVNLASGNASFSTASPSFQTVGGPVGVSYSYDSRGPGVHGLTGSYYTNCTDKNAWPAQPSIVRRDAPVVFDWGGGSPAGMVSADKFCVHWEGFITLPYEENWYFGAVTDDGMRIRIDGTTVVESWTDQGAGAPVFGQSYPLFGKRSAKIEIDYYENGGGAAFKLYASQGGNYEVPAAWLSPTPPPLPQGWTLSSETYRDLAYTSADYLTNSVVIHDVAGGTHEYRRAGSTAASGWVAPDGEHGVLAATASGYTLSADDGLTYVFDRAGKLVSATSGSDSKKPGAPIYGFDNTTGNLTTITDPVSGRAMRLRYGHQIVVYPQTPYPCHDPTGQGFAQAPIGMLCQIDYWDGTTTKLFYNSNGQLARIEDPSGSAPVVRTDFAYNGQGLLASVRDPLASDMVGGGARTDNDTVRTQLSYDGAGRVTAVTLPAPTAGAARPGREYRYVSNTETQVDVVGLPQPNGYARKVMFTASGLPGAGQKTQDWDANAKQTRYAWETDDRPSWTIDATGKKSSTTYDAQKRPTNQYGPAKEWCYTGQTANPNGSCSPMPRSQTAYDGAATFSDGTATGTQPYKGLAATYWKNSDLAGAPFSFETGFGSGTTLVKSWGLGAPASLGGWVDNWSARYTGQINLPGTGTYAFQFNVDDGARLYIDGKLVLDRWDGWCCGWSQNDQYTASAGWHDIRLDYKEYTHDAHLELWWAGPGVSGFVPIPIDSLTPRYDLATATKDADGKKTATEYDPERGLATATIEDPGGLNLRTETGYEPAGSGYARRTSRMLPSGAGSLNTYAYYADGAGDAAPANTCGSYAQSRQYGLLKSSTAADPDGAGSTFQPIVRQMIYDQAGRVVASRVATDTTWTCTQYDGRGRIVASNDSAGRTTTVSYTPTAANGGLFRTTTTAQNSAGVNKTTTEEVDLLGRTVRYTDELGTMTRSVYDQAGRVTATYRTFSGGTETLLATPTYNTAGRIDSTTEYASGSGRTSAFTYDEAGRLLTTTRPNQIVTTNRYNDAGRTELIWHERSTTRERLFSYGYSPAGRMSYENESVIGRTIWYRKADNTYGYDGAGRLLRVDDGGTIRNYNYDANTNRCSTSAAITNCSDVAYEYDQADRITQSPFASSYQYDLHGNLIATTGTPGNPSMTYSYDGNDHATVVDDGTTTVTETLAPSGRVLRRVVTPHGGGAATEDLSYGYDGPDDSPAYQIDNLTSVTAPAGTQARSSSIGHNTPPIDTTLVVAKPVGIVVGDVMIAGIAVRGTVSVTAPTGWTLIRSEANGSSMQLKSYYKVVSGSEPASFTWSLSAAKAAAGVIAAYSGIDNTNPIDTSNSGSNTTASTSIDAPTITPSAANERIVGLFATMEGSTYPATTITEPAGMVERGDDSADNGEPAVTVELSDFVHPTNLATGPRTATGSGPDRNSGQLIALKSAPAPVGTITVRGWTAGHNDVTNTLTVTKPTGTTSGDVLIAGVATRGTPTVTPPSGWTLARTAETGSSWTLQTYYRVAGGSEPANYTWNLSSAKAAAGTVTAYTGVNTSNPIGLTNSALVSTASTAITAPGVDPVPANDMIVGIFANSGAATFTPPLGMTERGEDQSNVSGQSHVSIETADVTQATTGPTGNKTATAASANTGAAQLITLRAATGGGGGGTSGPTVTTYITGPGGILVVDTNGVPSYPLTNAHGDIAVVADASAVLTVNPLVDEFGKALVAGTAINRLGWTGNQQRYTITNNGTIRMGVRLYDPNIGRFLSIDPVEGGSCNDYDYVCGDPINASDHEGTRMGSRQGALCVKNLIKCMYAADAAKKAKAAAKKVRALLGSERAANAFQHAYWMALTTYNAGADFARRFGVAHELDGDTGDGEKDLFNNERGIGIGIAARHERRTGNRRNVDIYNWVLNATRSGALRL